MKRWYSWPTENSFSLWHETVVSALNLPRVGVNQQTGEPEPDATRTSRYTEIRQVSSNDWRAPVDDEFASQFPDGMGAIVDDPTISQGIV